MDDVALSFDRVSKRYRVRRGWGLSIREELAALARRAVGRPAPEDFFWALTDVSFAVHRGETVGLIGSNGAGKSTALKILSRVTTPTSGVVSVNGKIGAMIEIGAGFHPDLSGRENVFLNGAIMGMKRAEIEAKFDRIVAFAEVERFIDMPLKYYSSGMMMRLGFAVTAHIDPDVLLIDEVLAVGDAAFQSKCLNKLAELRETGKTIVLVSHHTMSVVQHTSRVVWIDHGRLRASGEPERVVEEYLNASSGAAPESSPVDATADGTPVRITECRITDRSGRPLEVVAYGEPAVIEVTYEITGAVDDPVLGVGFQDVRGVAFAGLTTRLDGVKIRATPGIGVARLELTPALFTRGAYSINVAFYDPTVRRHLDFRVSAATFSAEGPSIASREVYGHVVIPHAWDVEE